MFDGHFKNITRPQQHTRYGLYLWYVGAMIFKKLATNRDDIGEYRTTASPSGDRRVKRKTRRPNVLNS
ncbi:unnamed protein product [Macrosiphum euphorbiae]|uniref:Uncharacterized protein n=1 Tax=Macrosiphum euphorbiae TaxID=13131 RepID=A0AAV0W1T1_9HEMI|nr:unnamed protein product [Macrosiphum euphorbiae]